MTHNVITLPPKNRERMVEQVLKFLLGAHPGKPVNVKVSVARPERTDPQNRYLFGVAYALLAPLMGFSAEEIHEWMCGEHFGWVSRQLPGGRTEQKPFRTTTRDENGDADKLDGRAFWDFVEHVQRTSAQAGVFIPDPNSEYKAVA